MDEDFLFSALVQEGTLVAVSMAKAGVVFSTPAMIRMLLFCTLVSLLVLLLAAVAHAAAPYSITGWTLPV